LNHAFFGFDASSPPALAAESSSMAELGCGAALPLLVASPLVGLAACCCGMLSGGGTSFTQAPLLVDDEKPSFSRISFAAAAELPWIATYSVSGGSRPFNRQRVIGTRSPLAN
jgi:hypothetical protein